MKTDAHIENDGSCRLCRDKVLDRHNLAANCVSGIDLLVSVIFGRNSNKRAYRYKRSVFVHCNGVSKMGLSDIVDAFDGELLALFLFGTYLVAGLGSAVSPPLRVIYEQPTVMPCFAPPPWLFGLV